MPTAASWTSAARRAVADVAHLLRFRAASVRRRAALPWMVASFAVASAAVAVVPALVTGAGTREGRALEFLTLLPAAMAGFLVLAIISAAASGGGRELLARDPATIHPISPTTDHLGALLLAPLNVAWLVQGWALLGSTAYAVGPGWVLLRAQVVMLAWLAAATAVAQVVAWCLEALRRTRHGLASVRAIGAVVVVGALGLHLAGELVPLLDRIPTTVIVVGVVDGTVARWLLILLVLAAVALAAVVAGAVPAHLAARRMPRDEARAESEAYPARALPRTAVGALLRTDRASVWRAVPMRRGLAVLALGPGIVALLGNLPWSSMTILPGLVASGGALLFGVNAWCLDGRGGLWRESLPVAPSAVFTARAVVLAEFLLVASLATVALGAVRAGMPDAHELAAIVATLLVVTLQVVGASMRWSIQRPYAVDLRSARATPAPPAAMVAYSSRLAVSTTLTGLVFSGVARVEAWELSVLVAAPFLLVSSIRLLRARDRWADPVQRARVATTVAA